MDKMLIPPRYRLRVKQRRAIEVQRALPFPIRKLQSDNGPEFPAGLFAERLGNRDPVSVHQGTTSRAERQGRTQSPH